MRSAGRAFDVNHWPMNQQTKIEIRRSEKGQVVRLPFNYKEVLKGVHPEQDIVLKPGDTIVVP